MPLLKDYSLKNLNTFGVDVNAKIFAEIKSFDDLSKIISTKEIELVKKIVLGGGSNILFTKDFDGLVLKMAISGIEIIEENKATVLIEAGSGVLWNDLVKFCVEGNYGGIENLTLIPGTVGAAPIQNIGAYGQELSDTFISLQGLSLENMEKKIFTIKECNFSYRSSVFKKELSGKFIITSVKLKLNKNPKPNTTYKSLQEYFSNKRITDPSIKDVSEAVAGIRRSKLPDPAKIGNAGSFFKNPEVNSEVLEKLKSKFPDIKSFPSGVNKIKISAGWLIEKCGWKDERIGDVGTSPDHALVICNFGNATGAEILEFAMRIKDEVANKFGIVLKEEVNIL